jgi:hemerythrin superfamily protein
MVADLQSRPTKRPEDRRQATSLMQRLVIQATMHEAVEEAHIWPLVRSAVDDGGRLADIAEEHEVGVRRVLHLLDSRRPGDIDFEDLVADFAHRSADHFGFEETVVWPRVNAALDRDRRISLGRTLREGEKTAPTRPHPSHVTDPDRHPAVAKSLALVDRGLDRITERGR